jgi:hypothetical protein
MFELVFDPRDADSMLHQNIDKPLSDCTALELKMFKILICLATFLFA